MTMSKSYLQPGRKEQEHTLRQGERGLQFGMQDLVHTAERVLTEQQSIEQHTQGPHLQLGTLITIRDNRVS